jgi:hypothetical protein
VSVRPALAAMLVTLGGIAPALRGGALAMVLTATACDPNVVVGYAPGDAAVRVNPPVTWPSGAHPGNPLQTYLDWGTWRGHPVDVAHVYTDRTSWQGVVQPGWPVHDFAAFDGLLVMSQPLYPEGGLGNNADCAAGAYDARWETLGAFLVDNDRADAVLRIGWGFNDPVKEWRVDADPADWIACFRRVVTAIRSTAPRIRIDWTLNSYASPLPEGGDPYDAYPGDAYVDIIGTDVYDLDPPARDVAEWEARCDQMYGLCRLFEFARARGKQVAIGEWGVASCGAEPGGDNPFFVQKMFETFADNDDVLAYEAYFDDPGAGVCSALRGDQNPQAAARYRELYR